MPTIINGSSPSLTFSDGTTQTSGITATAGVVGVASGGTGLASVGTSGNVLTSNGTVWTSSALPAGGVTSLNGQTGAITDTGYGAIGSYVIAFVTTSLNANDTTAGSNLTRNTFSSRGGLNNFSGAGTDTSTNYTSAPNSGNIFTSLGLSGTWRAMAFSSNAGGGGAANLFVRIS